MITAKTFSLEEIFEILEYYLGDNARRVVQGFLEQSFSAEDIIIFTSKKWAEFGVDIHKARQIRNKISNPEQNPYTGAKPNDIYRSFLDKPTILKADFLAEVLGTRYFAVADIQNPTQIHRKATAHVMQEIVRNNQNNTKQKNAETIMVVLYMNEFYRVKSIYDFIQDTADMVPCDFDGNPLTKEHFCYNTNVDWSSLDHNLREKIFHIITFAKNTRELYSLFDVGGSAEKLSPEVHRKILDITMGCDPLRYFLQKMPIAVTQYAEAREKGTLPVLLVAQDKQIVVFSAE